MVLLGDEAPIVELDELRPLIAEGHERGFLTFEQIAAMTGSSNTAQTWMPLGRTVTMAVGSLIATRRSQQEMPARRIAHARRAY